MRCRRQGSGPAIVLVHELGGSMASWDAHVEQLEPGHTVLTVDLPGHDGVSVPQLVDSPVGPMVDLDQVARDLAATLRQQSGAPAVVIGHSVGGTIAARLPIVDPGAARAVVIVDSMIAATPVPAEQRQALVDALARDRAAALHGFYGRVARPDQVKRLVESALQVPPESWLAYVQAITQQSIPDGGRAIDVPVLLQTSSIFLPEGAAAQSRLAEAGYAAVPDLTVDRFPKCMHWIHWEDPRGWRQSVERFLERIG